MEIPETDLKYQSDKTTTGSDELLTLSLRYKEPDSDTSKLLEYPVLAESYSDDMSDDMKFAACVAEFGMLLRDSKYINGISYANIADDLSKLPQVTEDEYKTELLYLVNLMSK